jgi:hypothetical protein
MDIRKIAVVGSFAAGAAMAFAPLASADPALVAPVDPLTSVVNSEVASMNSIFLSDTSAASVPNADVTTSTTPGVFDTVIAADAPKVADPGQLTILDYELYGVTPITAGIATDPGAYNVFNGALTEFSDAYNVELYSLLNPTLAISTIPAADLIGSTETIQDAFANGTGSVSDVATYFYEFGANDLAGYLDLPALFPALVP